MMDNGNVRTSTLRLISSIKTYTYTPPWRSSGGLGSDQLLHKLFNISDFLKQEVTIHEKYMKELNAGQYYLDHELDTKYSYAMIGLDDFLTKMIEFSEANPVYTTCLGKAYPMGEDSNADTSDVVFHYIYAEAEASDGGEPTSPVQYANWFALDQHPTSDKTVEEMMKYIEIEDEKEKAEYKKKLEEEIGLKVRVGYSIYQEAVEYKKFLTETKGKMVKEFVDVKDKDGKVIPAEISSDKEGNILVGPFSINYTEWGIDAGRGWAQFAGIYDFVLTTNDKPDVKKPLSEDEFEFIYDNPKRQINNLVKPYYPHSNEVFYLKIKKAEGRTEFRDIDFKMRYLNVTGSGVEVAEDLYYYKWTLAREGGYLCIKGVSDSSEGASSVQQQNQVVELYGQRTYMPDELHYGKYPVYLSLTKFVANKSDNGNQAIGANEISQGRDLTLDKEYRFKVDIYATREGAINAGKVGTGFVEPLYTYEINLKGGQTETITQYFLDGTPLPYFRIEEVYDGEADNVRFKIPGRDESENYRFEHGICGRFEEKNATHVECTNEYLIKSAKLVVSKTLGENAVEDEIYKLNISITDNANNILRDYSDALENSIDLRVKAGENVAKVYIDGQPTDKTSVEFNYYWWEEKGKQPTPPSYQITEEENAKYVFTFNGEEVEAINGTFEDKFDGVVNVNAVNNRVKSKIYIDKKSDVPVLENKDYFFKIKVGTSFEQNETLTIEKGEKEVLGTVYTVLLDNKEGTPYEVYEYPDEESQLADNNGTRRANGVLLPMSDADLQDQSKFTKVELLNKQERKNIDYKIKKTFEEPDVPKDDLVFTFDTNAINKNIEGNDQELSHEIVKASKGNEWTTDTVHIEWLYAETNPVITIKEAQDNQYFVTGLTIKNGKTGGVVALAAEDYEIKDRSTIIIKASGVQKLLEEEKNYDEVEFVFEVKNKPEFSTKIVINKIVQQSGKEVEPTNADEYAFKFYVMVQGEEEPRELIASNSKIAETIITWEANGTYTAEKGPHFTIYEEKKDGFTIAEVLVNGEKVDGPFSEKNITEDATGYKIKEGDASILLTEVLVDITNADEHHGSINIQKLLEDRYGNSITDSNKLFTFKIQELRYGSEIRADYRSIKVGDTDTYTATWTGGEAPEFLISEMKIDGHAVKDIKVSNNEKSVEIDVAAGTIKGTFEENKTINAVYTNVEVKPLTGTITITKKVASTTAASIPDRFDKEFEFTLDVTDKNGTHTENIKLKAGESYTYTAEWLSTDPVPTYTIKENGNPKLLSVTKNGEIVSTDAQGTVTGNFLDNSPIEYIYTNGIKVNMGRLTLNKALKSGSADINEDFYFDVTIAGEKLPVVVLKAGDTWESKIYTWLEDEEAPSFTITEENPENSTFDHFEIDGKTYKEQTVTGTLTHMANNKDSVKVVCVNETDENRAKVTVIKRGILNDVKNPTLQDILDKYNGRGFIVDVSIVYDKGKFFVGDEEFSPEHAYKTRLTMNIDVQVPLPEIRWFGKDQQGPKVIVHEVSMPDGWTLVNYNNNNVILTPGADEKIIVENEWSSIRHIIMPMGGTVWIDSKKDEKNTENSTINGIMDETEVGVPGVGVVVKRYVVDGNDNIIEDTGYAKAYDIAGNEIKVFPIYTDETGRWDVRALEIPGVTEAEAKKGVKAVKYGVEYIYDGYNYEPTTYIAGFRNEEGLSDVQRAQLFYKSTVITRNSMLDRSFALERTNSRNEFNSRFNIITGESPIASDNSTTGYAIGTDGTRRTLQYEGTQVAYQAAGANQATTSLVSELKTTDAEGKAFPEYQVKAYTLFNNSNPVGNSVVKSGLAYPFDLQFNVALASRTIKSETYVATDPYVRNVNLGLVYKENADTEVTKDVAGAKVIVNQKLKEFEITSLQRLTGSNSYLDINASSEDNTEQVSYELGLYKSDYYYRAQAYATNESVYKGLRKFYKDVKLGEDYEALMNLQAYVVYKITVRNTSPTMAYDVLARSIVDYSDNSLELVRADVNNYIKDDENSVGSVRTVAVAPYYNANNQAKSTGKMSIGPDVVVKDTLTSRSYNKVEMIFDTPVRLAANEYVDIYATYRLKKYSEDLANEILVNGEDGDFADRLNVINADGIELGNKANIAEMKSFSVYKTGTNNLAGRVDKDSAPNNLDIVKRNTTDFYEDDSKSAPVINVILNNNDRNNVTGVVWEDNEIVGDKSRNDGVALGDGKYNQTDEATIKGMNIELVEKIQIPTVDATGAVTSEYYEYDYTWPENYDIQNNTVTVDGGSDQTLKALTGFDATIASGENGEYVFQNVPTGAYVARFHYGDNNGGYTNKAVTFATGSSYTEGDVYKFPAGGDGMISSKPGDGTNTSAYDGDVNPVVYNGQDFKSAAYGIGLNEEWLKGDEPADISKAADSQARRLEVINKSRVLTNTNTTVLATANKDVNHTRLYDEYRMFADTPKITINAATERDFANVNFGIVERPETRLVLDKEIEEMILKDNSGRELIKVKYDINYKYNPDDTDHSALEKQSDGSYILANPAKAVTINEAESFGLDYLQALNKYEDKYGFLKNPKHPNIGIQNFRYIVYDTSMAESLTLETTYRITALNLGQADRTSEILQNMTSEEITAVSQILKANKFNSANERTYAGEKYGSYIVGNDNKLVLGGKTLEFTNRFSDVLGKTYFSSDVNEIDDKVVRTKVGQIIDYVDNTTEFKQDINIAKDSSWTSTTDDYLYQNDIIDKSIFTKVEYNVLTGNAATSEMKSKVTDKDGNYYDTTERHNIVLSVTNGADEGNNSNPDLLKKMEPQHIQDNYEGTKSTSVIRLKTSKSIDSEAEDLIFDNIAEIIRYENEVGRKTTTAVAGNADPKGMSGLGEFAGALSEIDASATEIITFSNPYGVSDRTRFLTEITIGIFSALVVVAVGIVVIKKKVL